MMQLNDTTTSRSRQHLNLSERIEIQTLQRLGHTNRSIARILGRSHSTINNEMKRGTVDQVKKVNEKVIHQRVYFAETGQTVYVKHREASRPYYKLVRIQEFIDYTEQKILEEKWSPDVVVGYTKSKELFSKKDRVCTRTLYRYNDENLLGVTNIDLHLKLRRKTKSKTLRAHKRILGQSIDERPKKINDRTTFGHWEIDTVIGKKNKEEPVLLTLTERLSRFEIIVKIQGKTEEAVTKTIESMALDNQYYKYLFQSITSDNGSEFAGLSEAIKGISEVYFTHPYCSWERGTNENHNGIIRRFIPKGVSLSNVTPKSIKRIASWMNNLPRKKLDYRTPSEVFYEYFNQIQAI
jgi:IS30 family transposase